MDTALELDSYDQAHGVGGDDGRSAFERYRKAVEPSGRVLSGRILEIGSGTGNLTSGIARYSQFEQLHCSDISLRFMQRLEQRIPDDKIGDIYRYLFDANAIPFMDEAFDAVVGHSILHHLLTFETTLRECHRTLKAGGVAMFGEPMMEGHALVHLAAAQILAADSLLPIGKLSLSAKRILKAISTIGARKIRNLNVRDNETLSFEDKFIFPEEYFRSISREIGYSNYYVYSDYRNHNDLSKSIKTILSRSSNVEGFMDQIEYFYPIIDAFSKSYQVSMDGYIKYPFSLNVFVK